MTWCAAYGLGAPEAEVVAEGVETREQADFLNARGEVIHQGYLFGRPQPAQDWLAMPNGG